MKKLLFGLIATIMFGFLGNAQSKVVAVFNSNETTQISSKIKIEINGKLHKKNPKRDGTICECSSCFGLCDFTISITNDRFSVPKGNHQLTLYVLEDINYVEDIFSIDSSLTSQVNSSQLTINNGDYTFLREKGTLKFDDGSTFQYYGKVVVTSSIK
jgi:hypothetical protein